MLPLDPNFTGCGRAWTNSDGRYRFVTIRPGEYPWGNHHNAWRPAHIHFSLFGPAFATRLVTQMYFQGDPLIPFDPIFNCTEDEKARNRLISQFDWETTIPSQALGYRFDIVLSGREQSYGDLVRTEKNHESRRRPGRPLDHFSGLVSPGFIVTIWRGLAFPVNTTIAGRILDGDGKPVPDGIVEIWQADSNGKYAHPDDPQEKPTDSGFTPLRARPHR